MEHTLQLLSNLLAELSTTWYNNARKNIKNQEDFEREIDRICNVLSGLSALCDRGASTLKIGKSIPSISEDRIDKTIQNIKKEKKFRVEKASKTSADVLAKWELSKCNSNSFLCVELIQGNYIHICGNDWNLVAYGYCTLSIAIKCWAEGRM